MAREYGNDRAATVAVRLSQQEKDWVKAEAQARGITTSELVRLALENFLFKGEQD